MRILIADDSSVSRYVLKSALEAMGYEVEEAIDGNEAWEALQRKDPPQLVLLDWMMPGMDGVQICREIRRLRKQPYTYIILVTARGETEDVVAGLESGADDYICKPFDPGELRVRITGGQRIVELQTELLAANQQLQEAREAAEKANRAKSWSYLAFFI